MELVLNNPAGNAVKIYLGGTQPQFLGSFDFFVTRDGDVQVWNWLHDKSWLPSLQPVTIDAGQKMKFEGEWNRYDNAGQPVPSGTYKIAGILTGETEALTRFELKTEPQELNVS